MVITRVHLPDHELEFKQHENDSDEIELAKIDLEIHSEGFSCALRGLIADNLGQIISGCQESLRGMLAAEQQQRTEALWMELSRGK